MKKKLLYLITLFITIIGIFILQKPFFMLYNNVGNISPIDYWQVMLHGLSLDATTAGYFIILPFLFVFISVWIKEFPLRKWLKPYYIIISILAAIIFIADMALYTFWGFKLDATVFAYLDSPTEAFASVSIGFILIRFIGILLIATAISLILIRVTPCRFSATRHKLMGSILLLVMGGGFFIVIRGGVTESTANIGQVYYSENQFLNHSAVNPCFSLLASISKSERFEDKYDFFPEEERAELFNGLYPNKNDSITTHLLNTTRPNIVIILLEGFGSEFVESLGGVKGVSPNIDRLSKEGVYFTNYHSNSFRTDRGVICALSGYLGLPQTSIMKIPVKSQTLPSIAKSLTKAGYHNDFLYGGDINFTNMKSYLISSGYQSLTSNLDFTLKERKTNVWGANDDITFDHLYNTLKERTDTDSRWHTTFLTLSSHAPFQVPFNRFEDDKVLNSFAYTDDCLGKFIDKLKQLPQWDDLLVICLPDHGILYHDGDISDRSDPRMYHAPMLWLGGAVKESLIIDKLMNQTDLAATLLGQLNLPHDEFNFSRDVFGSNYTYPFTFYTFNDGLSFRDSTGVTVFSNESGKVMIDNPSPNNNRLKRGQAILQSVYDDLGSR